MSIELDLAKVFALPKAYPRVALMELLPLPNPISMQVDPASLCNFKCSFCPTGDPHLIKQSGRGQMFMKMDLFDKILTDISSFEKPLKVLKLFKDGEPTLNPHFLDMVRQAKKNTKIGRVETTSNGSKLSETFNEGLVDAGLDRIVLSIEGVTADRYMKFARVRFDFDRFVEQVKHLHSIKGSLTIHIKTVAQNLDYATGEDRIFFDTFGPYADGIFIENTVSSWPDFSVEGAVDMAIDAYGGKTVEKDVCPYLFYSLSVNADGVVSPCCVDWNREVAVGNLTENSIMDIWHGEKLNALRRKHVFEGLKSVSSCGSCGQVHACTHDNLDGHKDALKTFLS
ncbi:MAG: hypothetical protein RIR97_1954 [Pseudomonadota bacterium]